MSAGVPLPADQPTAPIPPDPVPAGWWARRTPPQTLTVVILLAVALLVTGGLLLAQLRAADAARATVEDLSVEVDILRGEVEELQRTVDARGPGGSLTEGDPRELTELLEELWWTWLQEQLDGNLSWEGLLDRWFGPGGG